MSFIALREDLENRVRDFIVDQYNWQCFARDNFNFETQTGPFEIAIRQLFQLCFSHPPLDLS